MIISPVEKPLWKDAPSFATSLGVCDIPGDDSYGEWCWLSGINPKNFTHIEARPKTKDKK